MCKKNLDVACIPTYCIKSLVCDLRPSIVCDALRDKLSVSSLYEPSTRWNGVLGNKDLAECAYSRTKGCIVLKFQRMKTKLMEHGIPIRGKQLHCRSIELG